MNNDIFPPIPHGWHDIIDPIMGADYMQKLEQFLHAELNGDTPIYPPRELWFYALEKTPLANVQVVILGQDPYHQPQQAHGLAFSVRQGVKPPPSLGNMGKELHRDLGIICRGGNLTPWAEQGVLLLNTTLTVRDSQAGSHQGKGWEAFTDHMITQISAHCDHVVFMLWGAFAQSKIPLIDGAKHTILNAPHPSPLSAYRGFLGCEHFSACNQALEKHGQIPINWQT